MAKKKAGKKKAGKKKDVEKTVEKKDKPATVQKREIKRRPSVDEFVSARPNSEYAIKADDLDYFSKRRIHCGVIDVELYLMPCIGGRTSVLGEEMAGKTALLKKMVGALQHTCRQCQFPIIEWACEKTGEVKKTCKCGANDPMQGIFIDIEDSFDPLWAKFWGVEISKTVKNEKGYKVMGGKQDGLWVVKPTSGDYALDFTVAAIQDGAADFVAIDSIAFILSKTDQVKLVGEAHQPMQRAAFVARWLYKLLAAQLTSKMDFKAPATLLWANQYYTGMSKNPMSDPRQESGGKRAQQVSTDRMKILVARPERTKEPGPHFKSRYLDVKFLALKSKSRTPNSIGEYRLHLDNFKKGNLLRRIGTSDDADRLVAYFDMIGLFEKRKNSYWCLGREFKRIRDIIPFLERPDINYISRYFIMRTFLPASAQEWLLEEDFMWSPFDPDPAFELYKESGHESEGQRTSSRSSAAENKGSYDEESSEGEAFSDDDLF